MDSQMLPFMVYKLKNKSLSLEVSVSKLDSSVFVWHNEGNLKGVMCTHVDDFLFGGSQVFTKSVAEPLVQTSTIGAHYAKAFKYLELNQNQVDKEICIELADYITALKRIDISKERKRDRSSKLNQNKLDSLKTVIGLLGWIIGQTRPDLAFETCMLSSNSKNATGNEITQAKEILEKAKRENVILRFGLKGKIKNFKIIGFIGVSFGNLSDGSSQGYIIYLVNEIVECSQLPLQSKKWKRVVKSVMVSGTLIQVDCMQACHWIARLLNET